MSWTQKFRILTIRYIATFLLFGLVIVTVTNLQKTHDLLIGKRAELYDAQPTVDSARAVNDASFFIDTPHVMPKTDSKEVTAYAPCNEDEIAKVKADMVQMLNQKNHLLEKLQNIRKNLLKVPNGRSAIQDASDDLKTIIESLGGVARSTEHDKEDVPKKRVVCEEKFTKSTSGYPFFYNGWDMEKCTGVPEFSEVLTVALNILHKDEEFVNQRLLPMLSNIARNYSGMTLNIASRYKIAEEELAKLDLKVKFHSDGLREDSPGKTWNYLVKLVKTPYVLIARDMDHFWAIDARLERLVRQIESLKIDFVGAASRNSQGHWSMNCLQTTAKNFSLAYKAGYHFSKEECVFCDDLTGPFVAKTMFLKGQSFDEKLPQEILFHDFFLTQRQKNHQAAVCPDSMFYVGGMTNDKIGPQDWFPIAKKYKFLNILLWNNQRLKFSCKELPLGCDKVKGKALSPCCLKELADMIKFFMRTCEKEDMICELQEGTLLGALKFGKVLPWERDADLTFLSENFSKLKNLSGTFKKAGYLFATGSELWCCADGRQAGGTAVLNSGSWHAELYGQHLMDTEKLHWSSLPPTKILFDGMWVAVPRNPGMFGRNRYGHEIYRHAQHWLTLGHSTGWDLYTPNSFSPCTEKGSHSCLDQYSADGNLQFDGPEF